LALCECTISSTVIIGSLRIVLDLDIINVAQVVLRKVCLQFAVTSLLHLSELLFGPHVETERTDHAYVDAEAAVDTRAIDADEDRIGD
jgi:hypothetical protein